MGNSYFEFGALKKSLKELIKRDLVIKKTSLKSSANRGLFAICEENQFSEIVDVIPHLLDEIDVEERTYLSSSLSNDSIDKSKPRPYLVFECWWDINDHYFLCLGKDNAKKIIKGINAYKSRQR